MRSSWVEVDLDAIKKNTLFVKSRLTPGTKLLVPVKGDAYGHGALECARTFEEIGCDCFGVAIPEEGVELREGGITTPILVFGYTFEDDYELLFDYDLMPNISSLEQALALDSMAALKQTVLSAHISVDTGLCREGFPYEEAESALKKICSLQNIRVAGVFSQFATGDQLPDTSFCRAQFKKFTALCDSVTKAGFDIGLRHICDSGATLLFPEMHLDMVRPGTALYGMYCGDAFHDMDDIEVYPVLSVKSRIAAIRNVHEGVSVGYYLTWEAKRESRLALIPLGFVDGISRIGSNRGYALVNGVRCPIAGNISMDQLMLDITGAGEVKVGDEVVFCGAQEKRGGAGAIVSRGEITIEEAASYALTTDTEYASRMGKRLPRISVHKGLGKYE